MLFFFRKIGCFSLLLLLCMTTGFAQPKYVASPSVVINLPSRMLELYSGDTLIKEYSVAIGKISTPTPIGNFTVIDKEINPTWVPPGRNEKVLSGPDNPLGYRWIGFFELYGIHGTNAPWTIGQVVSNGCIRMQEENAEELFEMLPYGTPIKITYDRIKIKIDPYGQATLGIYPDVYKRKAITLADVNEKMSAIGLRGLVNEDFLVNAIQAEADKQLPLLQLYKVKVNNSILPEWGIIIDNIRYIPISSIAEKIQYTLIWNEDTKILWNERRSVNGFMKGDVLYISEESIAKLFGKELIVKAMDEYLDIKVLTTVVNDKILNKSIESIDGMLALPILPLAEVLGKKVIYNPTEAIAMLGNTKIPITVIEGEPYLPITCLNEYFNVAVYWDKEKNRIEVTDFN